MSHIQTLSTSYQSHHYVQDNPTDNADKWSMLLSTKTTNYTDSINYNRLI